MFPKITNSYTIKLSLIIIEYNCLESVYSCIESIANACVSIPYEIIVSSNSTYLPDKCDSLKKKFPHIKWIFNKTNKGFAGGMNSGILEASGKVVVIMNPDVKFRNNNIQKAIDYLMSNRGIGAIGPKIVDIAGNIQDSCREFLTPLKLFKRMWKRFEGQQDVILTANFNYDSIRIVDWVIGAFIMIRRDALEKVGLLDEGYFLYVEDMDWCKRIWDNGYKIAYYPNLVIEYKGDRKSISNIMLKKNPITKHAFIHMKSYLRFLCKNRFRLSRKA